METNPQAGFAPNYILKMMRHLFLRAEIGLKTNGIQKIDNLEDLHPACSS